MAHDKQKTKNRKKPSMLAIDHDDVCRQERTEVWDDEKNWVSLKVHVQSSLYMTTHRCKHKKAPFIALFLENIALNKSHKR